jgi:NADPH:quinone reductase-like Zn-dependent oxidoreductase
MKAVLMYQTGDVDVMRYEDVPKPEAQAGEVLVKVFAAGINPVDWKTRAGKGINGLLGDPYPMIPGWDVSGVVEAVGEGVSHFKGGDEVFGMVRFPKVGSAYAQYVASPESDLAIKPHNVDHVQAAAVPLAGLTAWQGLIELADIQAGERVMVTAAAGGVGHLAVQIAKWKGANVIGTVSPGGKELAESLGADELIDYTSQPFESATAPVDVVFDTVGGETLQRAPKAVKPGGRLVTIAGRPEERNDIKVYSFLVRPDASHLKEIATLMAAGHLKCVVAKAFPLSEVQAAHEMGEAGHLRGKIVLEVGQ